MSENKLVRTFKRVAGKIMDSTKAKPATKSANTAITQATIVKQFNGGSKSIKIPATQTSSTVAKPTIAKTATVAKAEPAKVVPESLAKSMAVKYDKDGKYIPLSKRQDAGMPGVKIDNTDKPFVRQGVKTDDIKDGKLYYVINAKYYLLWHQGMMFVKSVFEFGSEWCLVTKSQQDQDGKYLDGDLDDVRDIVRNGYTFAQLRTYYQINQPFSANAWAMTDKKTLAAYKSIGDLTLSMAEKV